VRCGSGGSGSSLGGSVGGGGSGRCGAVRPVSLCVHLHFPSTWQRLRKTEVQIHRLDHNQQQTEPSGSGERVRLHGRHSRQGRPKRRPKRKRNAETRPDHSHRSAPLTLIADIRRYCRR